MVSGRKDTPKMVAAVIAKAKVVAQATVTAQIYPRKTVKAPSVAFRQLWRSYVSAHGLSSKPWVAGKLRRSEQAVT